MMNKELRVASLGACALLTGSVASRRHPRRTFLAVEDEIRPRRVKRQQVADQLRAMIVSGELSEGDSLGSEAELMDRFAVSRPSMREALRILESERLVLIVRGRLGRVVVRGLDGKATARAAATLLQARNVSVADVFEARALLEPVAARAIAGMARRGPIVLELRQTLDEAEAALMDPEAFAAAFARFNGQLVALAGNRTLAVLDEILDEIVDRHVAAVIETRRLVVSLPLRRRGIRALSRLIELLEVGDVAGAEAHWRQHVAFVGRTRAGYDGSALVDNTHHYD
jgi:GntR family transcriptional repressor for pyruvate dehydrogenase complex